jgi:hypothetical protein
MSVCLHAHITERSFYVCMFACVCVCVCVYLPIYMHFHSYIYALVPTMNGARVKTVRCMTCKK